MPIRSRVIPAAIAAMLSLVGAAMPASADDAPSLINGGNAPGGWVVNADTYTNLFGSMGAGQPQGTVIADSGFRPYPHGFPLPNWGDLTSLAQNKLIYGGDPRVTLPALEQGEYVLSDSLNSLALRRTLGDGVCRDPKGIDPVTGECDLILGAELLAQMIETASLGGHCFGFAAAAAALYNGQIPANQVGASGLGLNAMNPMGQPAIQTITRLFGTQLLIPNLRSILSAGVSPTEVVQTLVRELPAGQVPYVLTVIGKPGGHAITPYAVLDRGNGLYDVAIYDNNYPLQAKTLTIDTVADTFIYTSATNPNAADYTWSTANDSAIALVPVADLIAVQECPVCRGPDQGTLVSFSAVETENANEIGFSLVDADQQPLDRSLWRSIDPLNPNNTKYTSLPLVAVDPGVEFGVLVRTGDLSGTQPLEVYAMSNGSSEYLLMEALPSNNAFIFGVGGDSALFLSNKATSPRIQQLNDGKTESIDVNGHPLALPRNVTVFQDWDRAKERVRYSSTAKRTLTWNVQVSGIGPVEASWVGLGVKVPAGSTIVVDYANATKDRAPRAWVVSKDGDRTSIDMQAVTQSLIDKTRDQIYVTQGPS